MRGDATEDAGRFHTFLAASLAFDSIFISGFPPSVIWLRKGEVTIEVGFFQTFLDGNVPGPKSLLPETTSFKRVDGSESA